MIIDAHLHVWSDDADRYPFNPPASPTEKASVEYLIENMDAAGVEKAVIVQPIHYLYDNRYVADCLRRYPGKFDAICLVDPSSPDAPDQLQRLVQEQGFGGMRLHMGRQESPGAHAGADRDPLWRRAEELDVCFIVLGSVRNLPEIEPIIARFPGVKVVIDHLGGPSMEGAPSFPSLENLLRLARFPRVFVKISNMNRLSREEFPHRDTFSIVRRVYDAFGPQRLMWGTDFPHVMRETGYTPALEMVRVHLDFFTEEDREWLFSRTALDVWKFGAPSG